MSFSNIALGLWLLSSPALFDYQNTALARSEALNGVAVMVLGILAPSKCGDGIDCARIAHIGRHSGWMLNAAVLGQWIHVHVPAAAAVA